MYKQMETPEIEQFLKEPRHGVIGTIDPKNARVQLNTVWWIHEEGRIWMTFYSWSNKLRNVKADPNVCLCIPGEFGDDSQVILYGRVDIIRVEGQDDFDEALDYRMSQKYAVSEEEAQLHHAEDGKDGPWVQLSFVPTERIGDIYDHGYIPLEDQNDNI
jgi:hypothetical protein